MPAAIPEGVSLAPFTGSVPAALAQPALLLHATSAPNQQLKRLQEALKLQMQAHASGATSSRTRVQQLGPEQLAVFGAQYTLLAWMQRQLAEEVGPAVDVLLGLLGV
jgi:hypothetical protein